MNSDLSSPTKVPVTETLDFRVSLHNELLLDIVTGLGHLPRQTFSYAPRAGWTDVGQCDRVRSASPGVAQGFCCRLGRQSPGNV